MAAQAALAEREGKFLADIRSDDEDVRYAAWSTADQMAPAVIGNLSKLLTADKPGVRKAAAEALAHIVHGVGKLVNAEGLSANAGRPDDPGARDKRQQVVAQLVALLDGRRANIEKVTALRHLSLVATVDDVAAIAKLIDDDELFEEAVFCLERIPGKTSEEALLAALPRASDEHKARILAALGHRRAEEAMPACLQAMRSSNLDLAMAAMKAAGRIGSRTGGELHLPDYDALSDWQKTEYVDSLLRYADAQVERGAPDEAWPIYREALSREEGHLQCAAIVGLAKIGAAEAAAAIFPKLSSDDNTVRITAQQAWHRLET